LLIDPKILFYLSISIPQIFFDDQHIGGYDDIRALEKDNKLQELLK